MKNYNCSDCYYGFMTQDFFEGSCNSYIKSDCQHCSNWKSFKFTERKPYAIILVGVPGSGKSTASKALSEYFNATVFSSDAYRLKLYGDETNQEHNGEIFRQLYSDVVEHLKSGQSIIIDATNINIKGRKTILNSIKNIDCYKIAYVINTPIDKCIEQDSNRDRKVGKSVILSYISVFEYPVKEEGFDAIYNYIDFENNQDIIDIYQNALMDDMNNFDQNNPHHKYSLGVHTQKLMEQFNVNDDRYMSALFHDIGKMATKTTDDKGISHYYNHANYSAYILASYNYMVDKFKYDFEEIIFYINYHMKIRDWKNSPKSLDKYSKLFGAEKINKLIEFIEADNIATGTE